MRGTVPVYFAGVFERRVELLEAATEVMEVQPRIVVTSRWIKVPPGPPRVGNRDTVNKEEGNRPLSDIAIQNVDDLEAAAVLALFLHPDDYAAGAGGRHWETGYAWARGKPIILFGGRQLVFHHLPGVRQVEYTLDPATIAHEVWEVGKLERRVL